VPETRGLLCLRARLTFWQLPNLLVDAIFGIKSREPTKEDRSAL